MIPIEVYKGTQEMPMSGEDNILEILMTYDRQVKHGHKMMGLHIKPVRVQGNMLICSYKIECFGRCHCC